MASASSSTHARYAAFYPREPSPKPSEEYTDDVLLALALQLEELGLESESRKGKERAGQNSDRHMALQSYQDALVDLEVYYADRRMALSIADAVDRDAAVIANHQAAEAAAARDREFALRLQNGGITAPMARTRNFGEDLDDTTSVYSNYGHRSYVRTHTTTNDYEESEYGDTASVANTSYSGRRGSVECSICFATCTSATSAQCPCDHIYCRDCLRKYISNASKDESMYPLKCCKIEVPAQIIAKFLTKAEYQNYRELALEYSTPNRVYCTNAACLKFIPPHLVNKITGIALCNSCWTRVCSRCKRPRHNGTCKEDEDTRKVLEIASQQGWKQCYNCNQMIELKHGCHHMTCHCKAEFCYVCGLEWKNCECELFQEERLFAAAAERVDRNAEQPLAPAVRQNRIVQMQQEIQENHDCTHPGWFQKIDGASGRRPRGGFTCEMCGRVHWRYILRCRHCGMTACEECKRFRL